MNRRIAALLLALAYGAWRVAPVAVRLVPMPAVSVAVPFEDIGRLTAGMPPDDRVALRESYLVLSRAVAADPDSDPVFVDTDAVRRAHRAALLVVWRGVLDNRAGEVAGLRESLERAVESRIGSGEIPMNPTLKADTARVFADIAASVR